MFCQHVSLYVSLYESLYVALHVSLYVSLHVSLYISLYVFLYCVYIALSSDLFTRCFSIVIDASISCYHWINSLVQKICDSSDKALGKYIRLP